MAVNVDYFTWICPDGGYVWSDGLALSEVNKPEDAREQRFLFEASTEPRRARRYNPLLGYPTLYKTFAQLAATEEAYAAFAGEYGWLGVDVFMAAGQGPIAEPLVRWNEEHMRVRHVADVLSAIQGEDVATLQTWFTIRDHHVNYRRDDMGVTGGSRFGTVAAETDLKEWLWKWAFSDGSNDVAMVRFAKGWCQSEINEALAGGRSGERESLTAATVLYNHLREDMTLHIVPKTLLAGMWLQCARVLSMNVSFRACEHCGKWFEVSPDARRKQTKYCDARCKVAAYRQRKALPI
jgi:hypothetical protein